LLATAENSVTGSNTAGRSDGLLAANRARLSIWRTPLPSARNIMSIPPRSAICAISIMHWSCMLVVGNESRWRQPPR